MCGIFGIYRKNTFVAKEELFSAAKILSHRGPDDFGVWVAGNIGMAHTRLSIHDLSSAGHQPMSSPSGRFTLAFNGEIYNYQPLRAMLEEQASMSFCGDSDTEILVRALEYWGVELTLSRLVGMFAFAVWDNLEKRLYLARDRFGEKPLYYGRLGSDLVFSSELKSVVKHYQGKLSVDRNVLATYIRYGYVPSPHCIYKDMFKLLPGHYLMIDKDFNPQHYTYWHAENVFTEKRESFSGSFDEATCHLETLLKNSLQGQMQSDVPLGAFLSGGIDSSTIVALMQSVSLSKINTFSIGFENQAYNEAQFAQEVAQHIGTHHTELYVQAKNVLDIIPQLPQIYDEPFADSSQIPTFLVSQLASTHKMKVALTGDGGDELFGGYNRYLLANTLKSRVLDNGLMKAMLAYSPAWLFKLMGYGHPKYSLLSDKLLKVQQLARLEVSSEYELYKNICSQNHHPNNLVIQGNEIDIHHERGLLKLNHVDFREWMMYADSQMYMIDDILTKVDRASMAVSLETRVPLLDHRIVEFAWSLPLTYKINQGSGKRILRELLYKYVPKRLIDRPKMGFGIPIGDWLRNELRDWGAALLDPYILQQQGYFDSKEIQRLWMEHQSGKYNRQYSLWTILMFQLWLENMVK